MHRPTGPATFRHALCVYPYLPKIAGTSIMHFWHRSRRGTRKQRAEQAAMAQNGSQRCD